MDRRLAQLYRASVREAVRHVGRADDDMSPIDDERLIAELERRLADSTTNTSA